MDAGLLGSNRVDQESAPKSPLPAQGAQATTRDAGRAIDQGKGRIFPCEQCGADLEFSIGMQSLKCPYCGHVKELRVVDPPEQSEHDLHAMLERLQHWHDEGNSEDAATIGDHEVRCDSCGANVVFQGTLTSTFCPFCASPLQRDKIHTAEKRISVDVILPFLVEEAQARANLKAWVQSLWFAPNAFLRMNLPGTFQGVYLPYFAFDSLTYTVYRGQRGDHYYVTVGSGKNQRRERRTRWSSAAGEFERFFDDVLVMAIHDLHNGLIEQLEPWPLDKCRPFTQEVMAGISARTYDVTLADACLLSRERMRQALDRDVRSRIGGDEQRVSSMNVAHSADMFKHLLLPVWLLSYRYQDKLYQVTVNAATGEVQGERPWSWVKITLAFLAAAAVAGGAYLLSQMR